MVELGDGVGLLRGELRDFADDVCAFMDAVGLDAALLVGASSGGSAAQRFAVDEPARTLGMALLGPRAACATRGRGSPTLVATLEDPIDAAFVRELSEGMSAVEIPQAVMATLCEENLEVPARAWHSACRRTMGRGTKHRSLASSHTASRGHDVRHASSTSAYRRPPRAFGLATSTSTPVRASIGASGSPAIPPPTISTRRRSMWARTSGRHARACRWADRSVGTTRCARRCAPRPCRPRRPATRPVHA